MDGSKPGEAGVLAWCNSLRLSIAQDPGREFLDAQIKKQGFDYLDSYLEDVFSRPKENTVYDLMKTPGRKRDGAKRTRMMAISTTAKAKTPDLFLQEDTAERKKPLINDFHRALLEAKASERILESSNTSQSMHSLVSTEIMSVPSDPESTRKSATVAENPKVEQMEVDEAPKDAPRDTQLTLPFSAEPNSLSSQEVLSLVVEPAVHSQPAQTSDPASTPTEDSTATKAPEPTSMQLVDSDQDNAKTRHTLAGSRSVIENERASPTETETDKAIDAAPRTVVVDNITLKELSMIAEGDEPEETEAADHPMDMEMTVPLKDESSVISNALKRKPSASQFSGLPAPSPLRKSMRMSREPSVGTSLFAQQTPGAGTRTSWLSKAREVKALESLRRGRHTVSTVGEDSSAGIAPSASSFNVQDKEDDKRKPPEGQTLGLGFVLPPAPRTGSLDTNSHAQAEVSSRGVSVLNGKHKASSLDGQTQPPMTETTQPFPASHSLHQTIPSPSADELASHEGGDVLERLKKTVEYLGARAGVTKVKGALAEFEEARAAAAARVAQRTQKDGVEVVVEGEMEGSTSAPDVQGGSSQEKPPSAPTAFEDSQRRFSISELMTVADQKQGHQVESENMKSQGPHVPEKVHASRIADASTSTTPPDSPLSSQIPAPVVTEAPVPAKPVFSKPPSVFSVPNAQDRVPASNATNTTGQKERSPESPHTNPFSVPASVALGIPPSLPPSSSAFSFAPSIFSTQTNKTSMFSDAVFSKDQSGIPEWMRTQDTDFSANFNTQKKVVDDGEEDMEEDDSWHMDENFRPDQAWTPFGFTSSAPGEVQDGTDTWSSFPSSTSRKGVDTGTLAFDQPTDTFAFPLANKAVASNALPGSDTRTQSLPGTEVETDVVDLDPDFDVAQDDIDVDMDVDDTDEVPLDINDVIAAGKATISLVKSQAYQPRSQSQLSMASSSSSQQTDNLGILGQASRFVSSMLGTNKKGKEPIKSLALATAVAKKQQEEAEKKASRLKDMEQRRQLAQQRKADEGRARLAEEEKKAKEDAERRKREREEHTDKRPLLKPTKKGDDTTAKKLKSTTELEKKAESKRPPSKDNQASRSTKPLTAPNTATKAGGGTFKHLAKQPSVTSLAASVQKPPEPKAVLKPTPSTSSLKTPATANAKGKSKVPERDDVQPVQMVQSQMAHRAKAQMQATTPRQPPSIASENIELPDINSEYSDSEDEDRPRTFDPPEWAQSPELRQALEQQSHMNPDDIFGRIGPLKMEEIFKTRQSRFRARTSSANWAGPDQLTAEEEREYARRMGFK